MEIVREEEIADQESLLTMLNFYHDLGVIVYIGGVGAIDSSLHNTVMLQPQWLLDIFRQVTTVKDLNDQVRPFMMSVTVKLATNRYYVTKVKLKRHFIIHF